MRNLFILIILLLSFNFGQAQNFFSDGQNEQTEERGFFERDEAPAQGEEDVPGNPGPYPGADPNPDPAPIDDWIFLLPLLGIAMGVYYLMRFKIREEVS